MNVEEFEARRRYVDTPSGRISYVEHGEGRVALFVHGVLLNGYLWRHQLAHLGDVRRGIAVDLLAHGRTERPISSRSSGNAPAGRARRRSAVFPGGALGPAERRAARALESRCMTSPTSADGCTPEKRQLVERE
jgi:pimeloyl-ACP methyl ester carboxylesterase